MIRKTLFSITCLLLASNCFAQRTEIGVGIGVNSYSGDLHRGYNPLKQNLAVQGYYRVNYDKDVSFRLGLLYGGVSGDDTRAFDALGEAREASFERNFIEASAILEFHFLDYKHPKSTIKWSPYLFGGVGITKYFNLRANDDFNSIQPVLPFGIGIKHLAGKRLIFGLEFGARKTFFDQLDSVSDNEIFDKTTFQFGNPADNDWYYHVGLTVSYVIHKIQCTYRYTPNKSLHR